MTHFALLKYYGIDWLAMILMFSSIHALGLKRRKGFLLGGGGVRLLDRIRIHGRKHR